MFSSRLSSIIVLMLHYWWRIALQYCAFIHYCLFSVVIELLLCLTRLGNRVSLSVPKSRRNVGEYQVPGERSPCMSRRRCSLVPFWRHPVVLVVRTHSLRQYLECEWTVVDGTYCQGCRIAIEPVLGPMPQNFAGKSVIFGAIVCRILMLKCTEFDFRWGSSRPDLAGEA